MMILYNRFYLFRLYLYDRILKLILIMIIYVWFLPYKIIDVATEIIMVYYIIHVIIYIQFILLNNINVFLKHTQQTLK